MRQAYRMRPDREEISESIGTRVTIEQERATRVHNPQEIRFEC